LQNVPTVSSRLEVDKNKRVEELEAKLSAPVADSYNNLGVIAARDNDYATAVDYFHHAAQWNPSLDGLDYNLGRAAYAAERFADAIAPLSRYLSSHPDNLETRSQLAVSLYKSQRYAAVLDTLAPILSTLRSDPKLADLYAQSQLRMATK
jgi:Flp pilus assembly protein TadD